MKTKAEIKILRELEALNAEWVVTYGETEDKRKTTAVTLLIERRGYSGYSRTSKLDNYNKSRGRVIALGRAFKDYKLGIDSAITKEEAFRLRKVTVE